MKTILFGFWLVIGVVAGTANAEPNIYSVLDDLAARTALLEAQVRALTPTPTPTPTPVPTPAPTPVPLQNGFTDSFESGDLLHAENGFHWNGANAGAGDAVSVSTDIAHSGSRSVKFTFGAGASGDDAWSELRFILGKNMPDVYIQWYQYFPNGAEGLGPRWSHRTDGVSNNKFIRFWSDDYTNFTLKTGLSFWPMGSGDSQIGPDGGSNQTGLQLLSPKDNAGMTDSRRGRWVKFQYHAKTATSANNNGVVQLWVDGVLVISNTTAALYPSGGVGNYYRNGYLMGWSNSGFSQTTNTYIDDVTISDTFIQ